MFSTTKEKIITSIFILLSSLLMSVTMFRSGLNYEYGIGFWGPNGHDAIWHLSLINQLKQNIPPNNPIFSGTILSNYHWGFDLIVALISKITQLSPSIIYFQIFPIIFAILLGFLSYNFARLVTKNHSLSLIFVFLNYFASSFGWIVTLIKFGQIGGESMFWSMQSVSTLLNPPYALSLIVLLLGLTLWFHHKDSKSILWSLITGFIFSLLCLIKVYSAILIGLSLGIYFFIKYLKTKKISQFNFFVCGFFGIFSLLILFKLGVFGDNSLLEFKPFWFTHSMIESIDKFYWPTLASYRYNQTNFLIKLFIELLLLLIFIVGNLGVRIFGFIHFFKKSKDKINSDINILFYSFLLISFIFPLLFVQKGTAWNTIQFFYYFLFIINFYLAKTVSTIYQKNKIFSLLIIILASVGTIGTLKDYFGNPPPSALPQKEFQALTFLKKQTPGVVLTFPYDKYIKNNYKTPIPLYAYETTAYVSAFSQNHVYLEDEMNLDITGFDWQKRRQSSIDFFKSNDKYFSRGFLLNNNIQYIYLVDNQKFELSQGDLQIDKIYDIEGIKIFSVQK